MTPLQTLLLPLVQRRKQGLREVPDSPKLVLQVCGRKTRLRTQATRGNRASPSPRASAHIPLKYS